MNKNIAFLLLLAGCATTVSPIEPIGKDTYMVNVDVISRPQSVARTAAAHEANAFCQRQGRIMVANGFDKHTNGLADFITLNFKCLMTNDPHASEASVVQQ